MTRRLAARDRRAVRSEADRTAGVNDAGPPPSAPVNTVAPTATTPADGGTSTGTRGTWTSNAGTITYSQIWQSSANGTTGWADIGGATSLTSPALSYGTFYRLKVTATNTVGPAVGYSNVVTPTAVSPVNTVAPSTTAPIDGATTTVTAGTWTGTATIVYTYQWQSSADGVTGWANLGGATSTTSPACAFGTFYRCQETATNGGGAATASSNAVTPVYNGAVITEASDFLLTEAGSYLVLETILANNTVAPAVTPTTVVDATALTSTQGTWVSATGAPTYSYQWQSSPDNITWSTVGGATTTTYTTPVSVGAFYRCQVTATDMFGSTTVSSNVTDAATTDPGVGFLTEAGDLMLTESFAFLAQE